MPNPEHVQILAQGVEGWNEWRSQDKDSRPDLRDTDLCDANLQRVNFFTANLTGADLTGADLSDANLAGAELMGTNLAGAILAGANLIAANLTGTTLANTNLSEAKLEETVFCNTNLTTAQGIETCHHLGPSILDHRTLVKSWPLPLAFLQGCGLPDALINYMPSLLNQPFQFYSCFISYASKDHAFAERLYADLQNNGVRCWFAPEDLKIGDRFRSRIDETIRVYDKLLLILSRRSVASQWVEQEVETALARERQQERGNVSKAPPSSFRSGSTTRS